MITKKQKLEIFEKTISDLRKNSSDRIEYLSEQYRKLSVV
jgi:hypothetical protein